MKKYCGAKVAVAAAVARRVLRSSAVGGDEVLFKQQREGRNRKRLPGGQQKEERAWPKLQMTGIFSKAANQHGSRESQECSINGSAKPNEYKVLDVILESTLAAAGIRPLSTLV